MGQYYSAQQAEYASLATQVQEPYFSTSAASQDPGLHADLSTAKPSTPKPSPITSTPRLNSPSQATPKSSKVASPQLKPETPKAAKPATPKASTPLPTSPKAMKVEADTTKTPIRLTEENEKDADEEQAGEAVLRVEVPFDLTQCKLAELRELASENELKTAGSKYELIGRLLRLFPAAKLTEEALSDFKALDLKSMAKGCDLTQAGSKSQLIASLIAHALLPVDSAAPEKRGATPTVTATPRAAKTPQPKRKRDEEASELQAPLTERKAKRARSGSATKK